MNFKIKKNIKAFTLVEIMIVVWIIALLAVVAIPNILRAKVTTNDTAAQATLKTISIALENYISDKGIYPPTTTTLTSSNPPYLARNYFTGTLNGFSYTAVLSNYAYTVTATPTGLNQGTRSFTITTGAVFRP